MSRVLDVGSGLAKYQGKTGDTVIGMDLFNAGSADVIHDINIFPYPFPDNYFDMVWVHHSFEHMDDAYDIKEHKSQQVKAVEEFWRITKPGGKVMIFVPHWSSFVTWGHIDHRRGYGFGTFNMFDINNHGEQVNSKVRFKVKSRIRWILYFTHTNNKLIGKMFEVITAPVEWVINRNYLTKLVTERFCYLIGGLDEVEFSLIVVKDNEKCKFKFGFSKAGLLYLECKTHEPNEEGGMQDSCEKEFNKRIKKVVK